jgi:hypothetical protein
MHRWILLLLTIALAGACDGSSESTESGPSTSPSNASVSERDEAIWSSASTTKMFDDPLGDSVPETVPYLDTVAYGVDVARDQPADTYLFTFEVAEPIPSSLDVPMNHDAVQYSFCLDTDPSLSPRGYPFESLDPVPCDFILTAVSKGGPWTGTLIDRRPLANGDEARTPRVRFLTRDANGLFAVPGEMLGNPEAFHWAMTASLLMLRLPSDDYVDLDANYEQMLAFQR